MVYLNTKEREMLPMLEDEVNEHILGITMDQKYSSKKGLNEFGEKVGKAAKKELKQLQDMPTFTPVDYTKNE